MSRSRSLLLLLVAFVAVFAAACAQKPAEPAAPPDTRAADEAAIRAADADWVKAAAAKDLEKCMSVYADSAVVFTPGQPAIVGKGNVNKFVQELLAVPNMQLVFHVANVDVARSGDLAVDSGTVEATVTGKNGKPVTQTTQYVLVWKKQADRTWKIIADTSASQK